MTVNDPRPELAAKLAARLAPAAEALAAAYEEDMSAGPPPQDDRAWGEYHRAGRAALAHLRQLLAVLDWAAGNLPPPAAAPSDERSEAPDDSVAEPRPEESGYDGSEDEYRYRDRTYVGSQDAPEFRAWLEEQKRRFGPLAADENDYDGSEDEYNFGARKYVGKLTTPEFEAWLERQRGREAEYRAAGPCEGKGPDSGGGAGFAGR